jgi:hypothetical protein
VAGRASGGRGWAGGRSAYFLLQRLRLLRLAGDPVGRGKRALHLSIVGNPADILLQNRDRLFVAISTLEGGPQVPGSYVTVFDCVGLLPDLGRLLPVHDSAVGLACIGEDDPGVQVRHGLVSIHDVRLTKQPQRGVAVLCLDEVDAGVHQRHPSHVPHLADLLLALRGQRFSFGERAVSTYDVALLQIYPSEIVPGRWILLLPVLLYGLE